jgi:hypothetical protein
MLRALFGGKKSKAHQLIKSCYPTDESGGLVHNNLDNLIKFALINPAKLNDIGQYIEKRTLNTDLPKQKFG